MILESIVTAKVLPLVVAPVVSLVRNYVAKVVPDKYIPSVLTIGSALVSVVAAYLGQPSFDLSMASESAWVGALVGLGSVGVHQVVVQSKRKD